MTWLKGDIRNFPYPGDMTDFAGSVTLEVIELPSERLALAWPLVRAGGRHADLAAWLVECDRLTRQGGGVIGIAGEGGVLFGLATFRPRRKPHSGCVLQVDTLLSFEISGRAPVRRALRRALNDIASRLDCSSVAVTVASRGFVGKGNCGSAANEN